MASKVTSKALKGTDYGIIQRGASFTLPVEIKDENDRPIDISGLRVEFTVKKVKTDFDRHDDFAYIAKSFRPQMPKEGKFFVLLSSDDTDFEPGKFYFDCELVNKRNGMVFRLFTFEFTLDGGPTNRRVNKGRGQWPTGDTITVIALSEGNPVVVVAPTLNLDGDVFGQLATIMDTVDAMEAHMVECEERVQSIAELVASTQEQVDALRQEFDADHVEQEELIGRVEELEEKIPPLQEQIDEIVENQSDQGLKLNKIDAQLGAFNQRLDELLEKYLALCKFLKLNP